MGGGGGCGEDIVVTRSDKLRGATRSMLPTPI